MVAYNARNHTLQQLLLFQLLLLLPLLMVCTCNNKSFISVLTTEPLTPREALTENVDAVARFEYRSGTPNLWAVSWKHRLPWHRRDFPKLFPHADKIVLRIAHFAYQTISNEQFRLHYIARMDYARRLLGHEESEAQAVAQAVARRSFTLPVALKYEISYRIYWKKQYWACRFCSKPNNGLHIRCSDCFLKREDIRRPNNAQRMSYFPVHPLTGWTTARQYVLRHNCEWLGDADQELI